MNRAEAFKDRAASDSKYFDEMDQISKKSAADRTFFQAAKTARLQVNADGLLPDWIDDEWTHTAEQGAKAACLTREDMIAVANVQYALLKRLDRNRNYMWVIIALLLYIALQFK